MEQVPDYSLEILYCPFFFVAPNEVLVGKHTFIGECMTLTANVLLMRLWGHELL